MVLEWGIVLVSVVSTVITTPIYYFVNKLVYTRPEYTDLYAVDINDTYKIDFKMLPDKTYLIKSEIEVDKASKEVYFIVNSDEHNSLQKEMNVENISVLYRVIGGYIYVYSSSFVTIQSRIFDTSKML